jgi:hypothetical protein
VTLGYERPATLAQAFEPPDRPGAAGRPVMRPHGARIVRSTAILPASAQHQPS